MKKPLIIVIVLVILGIIVWYFGGNRDSAAPVTETTPENSTVSAPISETTKVDAKLSSYKNEELGFSVKYPSTWEIGTAPASVVWVIPTEKAGPNTLKKLESKIVVTSGKCAFPPVTTVKERTTMKNGEYTFNMISMSNSAQGTNYFDRMYSLQRDNICYIFSFSSIYNNPTSAGFKGSEATQMANNNKAIVDASDVAFTALVKTFAYVVGPAGQNEAEVKPTR